MSVPHSGLISENSVEKSLISTLRKIRTAIGASESRFAEMMDLDLREFKKINAGLQPLSINPIFNLSKNLDLNIGLIVSGKIDYVALLKRHRNGELVLPSRYSDPSHQLARVRAIKSMFQSVELLRGATYASQVLSRLQLEIHQFKSPDDFVSPLVGMDFLNELERSGFQSNEISLLGTMTSSVARNTPFGQALRKMKNARELYRSVFEEHQDSFDKVWSYRLLSLNSDGCTMEVKPRAESQDLFKSATVGNRQVCLFLQGVFKSLVHSIDHQLICLTESECLYQGGSRCVYHLTWGEIRRSTSGYAGMWASQPIQ